MHYRPEIDGLRALAVIPVILFHAGFAAFAGGYVGVDVFFVISGYLITSIIRREIGNGTFTISGFYERRARRILPALLLVALVCIPFAWAWMLPLQLKDFAQSLVAVNLFASNVLFWKESGYFAEAAELKPLLHTWSLAVEEQFYLLFPLLLLASRKLRPPALAVLLAVISVVSLGLAEWASRAHPDAGFYLLPTRAWELGLGAILALGPWRGLPAGWLPQTAAALGLAMVAGSVFAFDETLPFPGLWAAVPVAGTALMIACADHRTMVGKALAWRPLVGLGLISYSAYLWHYPLFAAARLRLLDGVSPPAYLALSLAALVVAWVSWRYVETPFRNKAVIGTRPAVAAMCCASILLIGFGLYGHLSKGWPGRIPADAVRMAALFNDDDPHVVDCAFGPDRPFDPKSACRHGTFARSVHIWGDSHAQVLTVGLKDVLNAKATSLVQYTSTNCVPIPGYRWRSQNWNCPAINGAMADRLVNDQAVEVVVVLGRWAFFYEHTRFDNREGGIEPGEPDRPVFLAGTNACEVAVQETMDKLLTAGKKVVLVYPVPEVGWSVPTYLSREMQFGVARRQPLSTSHQVFAERNRTAYRRLDAVPDHPNLIRVRPEEVFCDTLMPGRCAAQLAGGDPLYYDDDHLNVIGATMLAEEIARVMAERGWL